MDCSVLSSLMVARNRPRPRVPCPTLGCDREAPEGSTCSRCYGREWKRRRNKTDPATVSIGRRMAGAPQEMRLRARIDTSAGPNACHPWTGATNDQGYGIIRWNGRDRRAHVAAWELAHDRSMRPGMVGCHTCDNPPCCNWRHTYEGTRATNYRDSAERGRAVPPPRKAGERHHAAKMTVTTVREARTEFDAGHATSSELADRYQISRPSMSKILRRESWREVT